MKLLTFKQGDSTRLGVLDGAQGDQVIDLNAAQPHVPPDLRDALLAGTDLQAAARAARAGHAPRRPLQGLALAPLVPRPGKIVCLGLNYFDHAAESGREKPDYPWFFLRSATSLLAHGEAAWRPRVSDRFDYEAEVAVVIGRAGRHVPQARALEHVFGYTCFNDMSVRDYQKRTPQWTIGKNFDRTGGFGPMLVTADGLPPGAGGLQLQCRLNGRTVQSANTADMIWSVAETIALLTECLTLEPGDVIVMGTPAGVGQSRKPPLWMTPGDRIEVELEGVGVLVNGVEDEAP